MTGQMITIKGKDGDFTGYLASPGPGRGPGLVVIQEIFGVNTVMREIADRHAHGRLLSVLEGGYSLTGLASGVRSHVQALQ